MVPAMVPDSTPAGVARLNCSGTLRGGALDAVMVHAAAAPSATDALSAATVYVMVSASPSSSMMVPMASAMVLLMRALDDGAWMRIEKVSLPSSISSSRVGTRTVCMVIPGSKTAVPLRCVKSHGMSGFCEVAVLAVVVRVSQATLARAAAAGLSVIVNTTSSPSVPEPSAMEKVGKSSSSTRMFARFHLL